MPLAIDAGMFKLQLSMIKPKSMPGRVEILPVGLSQFTTPPKRRTPSWHRSHPQLERSHSTHHPSFLSVLPSWRIDNSL
jgi:hypothetical protein